MKSSSVLFFAGVVATATLTGARSFLYASYDDRFHPATTSGDASGPFIVEEASISEIEVASSNVFFAVEGNWKRVEEDGGTPVLWWSGDAGEGIVAAASNGVDNLIWTYGSEVNVKNAVLVSPLSSSASAVEVANGSGLGDFVGIDSYSAWAFGFAPESCTTCPVASLRAPSGGTAVSLDLHYDAGESHPAVGARAIAVDSNGVDIVITPGRFMRFELDGGVQCSVLGFAANAAGVAASPDGKITFVLSGSSTGEGALTRFANGCPSADGGVTLDTKASLVITDNSAVFWSTSDGRILRAGFADDAGVQVGATQGAPVAIAISNAFVYAAVGSAIYRFPK